MNRLILCIQNKQELYFCYIFVKAASVFFLAVLMLFEFLYLAIKERFKNFRRYIFGLYKTNNINM